MAPLCDILISNPGGLSCRLQHLFRSGEMCDITLCVGSHSFSAHKLILCASSDVFKTMLTNKRWTESSKRSVMLIEDRLCEKVFDRFLNYIYTGQLIVSRASVGPLMMLADKYDMKELIPLCREYMLDNMDSPSKDLCVLQWFQIATLQRDRILMDKILNYIELNFSKVVQCPQFINTNASTLHNLLQSTRLVVESECTIFYAIKNWLQANERTISSVSENGVKCIAHRMMSSVRWPLLTLDDFKMLQEDTSVISFIERYNNFLKIPPDLLNLLGFNFIPSFNTVSSTESLPTQDMSPCYADNTLDCDAVIPKRRLCSHTDRINLHLQSLNVSTEESQPLQCCGEDTGKSQALLRVPRVYINDYWSSHMTVANFSALAEYETQTFFFSTPKSGLREDPRMLDWEVEVHPKGVHFPPAILIGLESDGNKMVEEAFINTVRVSIMSRSPQELPLKVEVNVLVPATHPSDLNETRFIEQCHRKVCIFNSTYLRHNLDDVVPLERIQDYLEPVSQHIPDLGLPSSLSFTLRIVIRPLA